MRGEEKVELARWSTKGASLSSSVGWDPLGWQADMRQCLHYPLHPFTLEQDDPMVHTAEAFDTCWVICF